MMRINSKGINESLAMSKTLVNVLDCCLLAHIKLNKAPIIQRCL